MSRYVHLLSVKMRKWPPLILTCICTVAILYLTLVPKPLPDNDLQLIPGMDKIVHGIMFGGFVLCLFIDYARRHDYSIPSFQHAFLYVCTGILFGGMIEIAQLYMNLGRGGDFYDFIADSVGAILFAFLSIPLIKFFKRAN